MCILYTFREDIPIDSLVGDGCNESFLVVLQTKKQKEWLLRYGNDVTCMDAIHKTVKYGFPCFFLIVRTSIGIGHVVGTIVPQYETEELITEGLSIIKKWNPDWKPQFFMMDKSSAELGAVAAVHPQCFRLLCDFHRAQAVERWVNKGTNGVQPSDKALVTDAVRRLAYATTGRIKEHNC